MNQIKMIFKKKETVEIISGILAVIVLYVILHFAGIGCPIKFLTGISCAGCGMTRAWIALLHFHIREAFYFHPLFLLPPALVLLVILKKKINRRVYRFFIFTIIILFVIVYGYRMISGGQEIVVFQPENGLIYRLIHKIIT